MLGLALQATVCGGVWLYGELAFARICQGRQEGLGQPKLAGIMLAAADGFRVCTALRLRRRTGLTGG